MLTQRGEQLLSCRNLLLDLGTSLFKYSDPSPALSGDRLLLGPLCGKTLQLSLGNAHTLADSGHLRIKLLEHVAGSHRLVFGLSLLAFEAIEKRREVSNFPAERQHSHFFLTKSALEILNLPQNFPEFALHRKRALGTLFAAGDSHVVEAFSGLREKKRVGIL
jgi:hypothetical protein